MRFFGLGLATELSLTEIFYRMRSIHAKAWDGSPFILRQIEGVGEKSTQLKLQLGACAH